MNEYTKNTIYYMTEHYLAKKETKLCYGTTWINLEIVFGKRSQTQSTNIV